MKLKWFGTATVLIERNGTSLLFDPFFALNDKVYQPPINEFSSDKHILITHGHFDHISDIPMIMKHEGCNATIYCTATPQASLLLYDINNERIRKIKPGDVLNFGHFEVSVLKSKHIVFNKGLIIKTLFNPRIIRYWSNIRYILKEHKKCGEAGETVAYDIKASDKRILLLGSLNLDNNTEYPQGMDLLILPFQGRSNISRYAVPFIERLLPKKILLTHFDDTYPPISSNVKTEPFLSIMQSKYPHIPVICPKAGSEWIEIK